MSVFNTKYEPKSNQNQYDLVDEFDNKIGHGRANKIDDLIKYEKSKNPDVKLEIKIKK